MGIAYNNIKEYGQKINNEQKSNDLKNIDTSEKSDLDLEKIDEKELKNIEFYKISTQLVKQHI